MTQKVFTNARGVIDIEPPPEVTEEPKKGAEVAIRSKTTMETKALEWALDAARNPSTVEDLDEGNQVDREIAKVKGETTGTLIDITRLAGRLTDRFALAPIRHSGRQLTRRWQRSSGHVHFYVGRSVRMNRWHMYFEPGTIVAPMGDNDATRRWTERYLPIPHIPAEYREAGSRFIAWEQDWQSNLLLPTNPIVLDHVAGDVFKIVGGWQFSELEIAAMRKVR